MLIAGCAATQPGQAQRHPDVPADAAVPALLNTGGYPTEPRQPLGWAGPNGNAIEAHRMFDALVLPFQVDPSLTVNFDTGIYKNAAATKSGFASPVSDAVADHEFVVGIQVTGVAAKAGDDPSRPTRLLSNGWLRFSDAVHASAALADMSTRSQTVTLPLAVGKASTTTPISVPRHPETTAVSFTTVNDPSASYVLAFTARGPYVLTQRALSRDGADAAAGLVAKALDQQMPMIDGFSPTATDELGSLKLDPTGMVARTMEPLDERNRTVEKGSYSAHGALAQFQSVAGMEQIFTDAGVDTVTFGETTTYRARDADAAGKVVEAFAALEDPFRKYEPSDGVPGLPGSRCWFFASPSKGVQDYACFAAAGNVAFEYSGTQEDQVHQVMAAQYLMLTAK
ncbi:MAG: hypothetical protein KDB70_05000 [Mycobacterium sp.]|nr:hypothetical protein [Mycobacterium sp.]